MSPSEESPVPLPPPGAASADGDTAKGEALLRRKLPFWRRLGGEGLVASVVIHIALILIAVAWVVSTITDAAGKKDPNSFSTGAGGGSGGPTAKQFKTKTVPKNMKSLAKANTRITSKNANSSLAIASLPSMSNPLLSAGAVGGGSSKGFGGGSGGGIGSGRGAGVGGGKNFVSLFGAKGGGVTAGIPGNFYDLKQTSAGKPSPMFGVPDIADIGSPVNAKPNELYRKEMVNFLVDRRWSTFALNDKFKAPDTLYAGQFFVPLMTADGAPKAYGVADKVKASRWLAHYKGVVKCPQTAKFRFVGSGDDYIIVRWDRKIVLDSGYYQATTGPDNIYKDFGDKRYNETHPADPGARSRILFPVRCGPWLEMTAGKEVPVEFAFGEMPGGHFYVILCIEVMGADGKGTGLKLLRFTPGELPEEIRDSSAVGLAVDMEAKGWIFQVIKTPGAGLR